MLRRASENLLQLKIEEIGEHYGCYRLHVPEAKQAMAKSLERYGQLSPVVVCRRGERYELIDGFKRLGAARHLAQVDHLSDRLMGADERTVKAAIYGLKSRRWPHARTGRSLDHSRSGARGRHEPDGSGGVAGEAQELGVPASGVDRAARYEGARRLARRTVVAHGSAADRAVAAGQPGRGARRRAARGSVVCGTDGRGRCVAGVRRFEPW